MALAIEAVQSTPLHISQHIDAAIIISTERAAASARRERHVRRPCLPKLAHERLLSVTLQSSSLSRARRRCWESPSNPPCSFIKSSNYYSFHHQHHHLPPPPLQLAASLACLPAHGRPTHIPINILLPLSLSLPSPHSYTYLTHTLSLSLPTPASLCPTPYPALLCASACSRT
jgi:hypothetical protein